MESRHPTYQANRRAALTPARSKSWTRAFCWPRVWHA